MANLGSKTLITIRNYIDRFLVTQFGDSESKEATLTKLLGIPISRTLTDSDTLAVDDAFNAVVFNIASNKNCTINNNVFAAGDVVFVERTGVGTLSFVAGSGMTITTSLGALTDADQDNIVTIKFSSPSACNIYNGSPSNATPQTRLLGNLDLSADRSSSALNIMLGAAPYVTGRLYGSAENYTTKTTAALGVNVLKAQPFLVRREMSIDAFVAEVTTVGSFNFRMGIYADNGSGFPGARVAVGATEADGSTPAAPSLRTVAVTTTLQPGFYWLAIVTAGSITFRADANGAWPAWTGFINGSNATIIQPHYTVAFTYAALPDPFPVGAAFNVSGTPCPIVWVKKA